MIYQTLQVIYQPPNRETYKLYSNKGPKEGANLTKNHFGMQQENRRRL